MTSSAPPAAPSSAGGERRTNLHLREIFDVVYAEIEPFFDPRNSWGGHSLEHLAFRVVRENHPELSQDEVHQAIVAVSRVFHGRNPHLAGQVPGPDELRRKLFG